MEQEGKTTVNQRNSRPTTRSSFQDDSIIQLCQEMEETRQELERQNSPNDMSITTETTRQQTCHVDTEELKVASELQCLREELERLQVSHRSCESELESVRQQADTLQCELDKEVQEKNALSECYRELRETLKCSQETPAVSGS